MNLASETTAKWRIQVQQKVEMCWNVLGELARCFLRRLLPDILAPLAISRAALVVVAWLGFHFLHFPIKSNKWEIASDGSVQSIAGHLSPNAHPFVNMWARWDGGWYLDIAKHGYRFVPGEQSNVAFFPLYPYLFRFVGYVIPIKTDAGWLSLGVIVSNTAFFVALVCLYKLVHLDYDRATAARAVLYLCIFPTTLFLSAVYSESLFLALVIGAFYCARANRWIAAGILAAAATLCRPVGLLVIVPLAFEYMSQREFHWRRIQPGFFALTFSPLALVAYLSLLRWRFGSWNIISKAQASEGWNRSLTPPWNTLLNSLHHITSSSGYHGAFEFFFTLALLGLTVFACFRLRLSYAIYSVVSVLFITSWGDLTSAPRFGLVIFPLVIGLALLGHNRMFNRAYIVVSAVLAAISMVVFSQWAWVA
jgi:Gpi18-like mannosyltransferase